MIKKKTPDCAGKIWKKFTYHEKRLWNMFYRDFKDTHGYPYDLKADKEKREVIAHNHACLAVWALQTSKSATIKVSE